MFRKFFCEILELCISKYINYFKFLLYQRIGIEICTRYYSLLTEKQKADTY